MKEQEKKKARSRSSQLIYLCKILRWCVITELKVELGDKNTGATTKDSKHKPMCLRVYIHRVAESYIAITFFFFPEGKLKRKDGECGIV